MMTRGLKSLAAALCAAVAAQPAASDEWSFVVTPYIWAPSFDATFDIGANPPATGSTSLLDILDGAFLIFGEARRGAWSIWGEYNYLDLSDEFGETPAGDLAEVAFTGNMAALLGGYAFQDTPAARIEAVAGVRYWDIETTTRVLRRTVPSSHDWVDPVIGLRFAAPLSDRWTVSGMANAGGFGVGSDLQWDALLSFGWSASDLINLSVGYRYLALEFDEDSTVIDMDLSGPFVSIGFKF